MPATLHDYDINFWIGGGDALHTVRMEQFPNRDIAVIAGADALFEWAANDPDKPLPQAAIDYWLSTKSNTALSFSDVQMSLEAGWFIQFSAKQVDNTPAPPPPPAKSKEKPRAIVESEADVDITSILKDHLSYKLGRAKALSAEITEKQKLLDRVENDIARMELMLASTLALEPKETRNGHGDRRKRAYKARRKESREVQQACDSGAGFDEGRVTDGEIPVRP